MTETPMPCVLCMASDRVTHDIRTLGSHVVCRASPGLVFRDEMVVFGGVSGRVGRIQLVFESVWVTLASELEAPCAAAVSTILQLCPALRCPTFIGLRETVLKKNGPVKEIAFFPTVPCPLSQIRPFNSCEHHSSVSLTVSCILNYFVNVVLCPVPDPPLHQPRLLQHVGVPGPTPLQPAVRSSTQGQEQPAAVLRQQQ